MARVVIMQPYVPSYRVPLFSELATRLREQGHELVIASGEPTGSQADRHDSTSLEGVRERFVRTSSLKVGSIHFRFGWGRSAWRDADVIVAELAAGSLTTYGALMQRRRPVAVWGHVDAFVQPDIALGRALRRWQARTSSRVLAYTKRGAALARRWGVPADKVTNLQNTVDTADLSHAIEQRRSIDSQAIRERLGVGDGPVFAMIGGIDESKRVDLVVAALDLLWQTHPSVQLVVGGRGELEPQFKRSRDRGQVRMLGYVGAATKADIARVAVALLNPGRVGLVAVESMAMALPIITTRGTRHGPEFDYLEPETDCLVCAPEPAALAEAMTSLADHPDAANRLASAIAAKSPAFALAGMVDRYTDAIDSLLQSIKTRSGHPKM